MSFTSLQYHIVFATKGRRPWLTPEILSRTIKYIGGIAREIGGSLAECNGQPDHLHLAAIIPASMAVSDFVRRVKTASSRWLHQSPQAISEFGWQDGYSAFSVSLSQLDSVAAYIRRQQEHHRRVTFEEELIVFFERHGIPYDKRYLCN